jgi:hypothetical protein
MAVALMSFEAIAQSTGATPAEAKPEVVKPASLEEAGKAQAALEEMIRAYESGNIAVFQNKLDPGMIGYQTLIDGIIKDITTQRRARITLTDTQVLAGPDVTVVQTRWEKRFLSTNFAANLFTGRSTFLMHKISNGGWQMTAFAGDNLFAAQSSGTLAQINFQPAILSKATVPIAGCGAAFPNLIQVFDPDLAGQGTKTVEVTSSGGEKKTLALTEVSPGRFSALSLVLANATGGPTGNPNCFDVQGLTSLRVRFIDNNPGDNRPVAATVTKTLTLTP